MLWNSTAKRLSSLFILLTIALYVAELMLDYDRDSCSNSDTIFSSGNEAKSTKSNSKVNTFTEPDVTMCLCSKPCEMVPKANPGHVPIFLANTLSRSQWFRGLRGLIRGVDIVLTNFATLIRKSETEGAHEVLRYCNCHYILGFSL